MANSGEVDNRWGIRLPHEYLAMAHSGLLDSEHPNYLRLTDVRWFHLAHVFGQDIPEYWKPGVIPFAGSPKGDRLCWVLDWQNDRDTPTAFCLRGASWANGYAPNFVGTVYRALLEEFSGSMLEEST